MKKNSTILLFNFSHFLIDNEIPALLGDKFLQGKNMSLTLTRDLEKANVVAWDGMINSKNNIFADKILSEVKKDKVLLLLRNNAEESFDINLEEVNYVELSSWSALPEEILMALMECQKKLKHV